MDKQNSYDFQNRVRDLSDAFAAVITQNPVLASLIAVSAERATDTKHEWLELSVSPVAWTLSANYTSGGSSMTFATNAGAKVGDIIEFEKPTGARSTLIAKVATVNSNGTGITFTIYGSSTDENLTSGTKVNLQSRPKKEGTDPDPENGKDLSTAFNYTQIFDRTAKVSLTAQNVDMYGISNLLGFQVEEQLRQIAYEVCRSLYRSPRVQRSASEAGTMGGLLWFMQQASGNKVLAGGNAIDEAILNDALQAGKANGALNLSTILAHPVQARKISRFNRATGSALMVNVPQGSATAGSYVREFVGELGTVSRIVVDETMDQDKIAIIDPSKNALKYLKNRQPQDKDATPAGADYVARRIIMESTLEVKNAETQVLITGLEI